MEVINNTLLKQIEEGVPGNRTIVLRSIYKTGIYKSRNVPVGGTIWLQPKAHPTNIGQYLGVEPLSDVQKQERSYFATGDSIYELKDGATFDLDNPMDEMTWNWVKHCDVVATTKEDCQGKPDAQFYIEQEGLEAAKTVKLAVRKAEAYQLVSEDSIDMLAQRSGLLGVDMEGQPTQEIRAFLFGMIETNLDGVLRAYKDKDIKLKIFLARAIKNGVISHDSITGYYEYGNVFLGTTETSVISTLRNKENKDMAEQIYAELEKVTSTSK